MPLKQDYPPKTLLNIFIAVFAYTSAISLLYFVEIQTSWYLKIAGAILFALFGNTIFSLLHESVHESFSRNRKLNNFFGRLSAAFFPTSFSMQKHCHLGHHRRNRTDVEMFDQYYKTDNKFLKRLQLLTVVSGFYWTSPPFGCLVYLFCPWVLDLKIFRSKHPDIQHMSADAMISDIQKANPTAVRLEVIYMILFQASLFYFLGLSFVTWILCYWSFALAWASLQYADHAWSKRDIRNGAWNLRVNPIVKLFYLNYHDHKVHHIYPYLPWVYLPKFVDKNEKRPTFWEIYFKMCKGPTLTEEPNPKYDKNLDRLIYDGSI